MNVRAESFGYLVNLRPPKPEPTVMELIERMHPVLRKEAA